MNGLEVNLGALRPEELESLSRRYEVIAEIGQGSMGIVYHARTGQPPFDGPSTFAILLKHKMEPLVSPQFLVPSLSNRMNACLERCLSKAARDRFGSFSEVAAALNPDSASPSPWDALDDPKLAAPSPSVVITLDRD